MGSIVLFNVSSTGQRLDDMSLMEHSHEAVVRFTCPLSVREAGYCPHPPPCVFSYQVCLNYVRANDSQIFFDSYLACQSSVGVMS